MPMKELDDIVKVFSDFTDVLLPGDLRYVFLGFMAPLLPLLITMFGPTVVDILIKELKQRKLI